MPAINPAQLKIRCVETAEYASVPEKFLAHLHDLLNFYADRVQRPGEKAGPPPLIKAYQPPRPVMKRLLRELSPFLHQNPQQALTLADALWAEEWLETRQLAASILGQLSLPSPEPILERVRSWGKDCREEILQKALFDQALSSLRVHHQGDILPLVTDLLESDQKEVVQGGLRALPPLIRDDNFQNLPAVFRILSELLLKDPFDLTKEISQVVQSLADDSEGETAYFLQKQLKLSRKPMTMRVVRRSLPAFRPDLQEQLKEALREIS